MINQFTKIYTVAITIVAIVLAAGCKNFDAPSVTNFFSTVEQLKTAYCAESAADVRAKIIAKIRESHPDYPEHGFCSFTVAPTPIPAA